MCASVISTAEAVGRWAAADDPDDDPVPARRVSLAAISPALLQYVEDHMGLRVWPVLQRHWPHDEFAGLQDAFVIRLIPAADSSLRLHHDVAQVSASVRLNPGYGGGDTEFPRQRFTDVGVPVGHLLAWPSLVTHPHGSTPVTSGVKYSLAIRCRIPGLDH